MLVWREQGHEGARKVERGREGEGRGKRESARAKFDIFMCALCVCFNVLNATRMLFIENKCMHRIAFEQVVFGCMFGCVCVLLVYWLGDCSVYDSYC